MMLFLSYLRVMLIHVVKSGLMIQLKLYPFLQMPLMIKFEFRLKVLEI